MNDVLVNIAERRSVRAFKPQQITDSDLSLILQAGTQAPSSRNLQPWHFTVIQDKDLLDRIVADNKQTVLADPNLVKINPWINAPGYHNFYNAPTVILISGHTENPWHVCDCALAMENMSLAAHSVSAGTCIVVSTRFVFKSEKAQALNAELGIPQGYAPLYALALGYPADENVNPVPRKQDCVNYIRPKNL